MHCVGVITLVTRSIDRPHHSAYTPRIHRPIDRSIDSFDPPSPRPSPLSPQLEHDEKKKREEEPREAKREVLPGLEPGSSGSEPEVLTNYTIEPSLVTERKRTCLDRGSNTGPLDLQSNALPTELSKRLHGYTAFGLGPDSKVEVRLALFVLCSSCSSSPAFHSNHGGIV